MFILQNSVDETGTFGRGVGGALTSLRITGKKAAIEKKQNFMFEVICSY